MITFVLILGVVACGFWFVYFVAFSPIRDPLPASNRQPPLHTKSYTDNLDLLDNNTIGTWTAQDDAQLSRLLEGQL